MLCNYLSRFIKLPHPIKATSNGLFFGAFVFLSGIGYGILNDLFACRNNLEYFKYGHNEGQDGGLLKEQINDPNVHAFAWVLLQHFLLR